MDHCFQVSVGFDLGFDDAGMQCAWQVENDKACISVLEKQWPTVRRYRDVVDVGKRNLARVRLIVGGFPCQDLSVARKGKGLAGERSGLWYEFHRIITELRPEWVVIENVPSLLSSYKGKDFAILLGGLTGILPKVPKRGWGNAGLARGPVYKVAYRILDAQFFGVAQRRRRVFVVASLGSGRSAQVLFECTGSEWNSPQSREKRKETTEAPARCIDVRNLRFQPGELSGTLQSKKSGGYSLNYQNPIIIFGGNQAPMPDVRRLTPIEDERLQGFPDGFTGGQSDSVRYQQLGNAVVIPVARWLGKRIMVVDRIYN